MSLRDVVPVLLDRVGQFFMYLSALEYTAQKLSDVRDNLEGTIKDVLSSLEEKKMNGFSPLRQADDWIKQGLRKSDRAYRIITRYHDQFGGSSNGVQRGNGDEDQPTQGTRGGIRETMLHCPCDCLSRRMFNAEMVMWINQLKEHKAGGNIYVTGERRGGDNNHLISEDRRAVLFEVDPLGQSQIIAPLPRRTQLPITSKGPKGSEDGADRDIHSFFPLLSQYRDIDVTIAPERLQSVTIRTAGIIDAFSFSYIDQRGKQRTVGPWGAGGPHDAITTTVELDPEEVVIEISGTIAKAEPAGTAPTVITSLKFVTNTRTHGPIGNPIYHETTATTFRIVAGENKCIVGFFGRSSRYLNAIGVYMIDLNQSGAMS